MSALSHSQKSNSKENRKAMLWRPCFSGHWNVVDSRKNPLTQHKQQLDKRSNRLDRRVCSVQFSHSVVSYSFWPHGLQHARLPCPSPTPRACSNSCPTSRWRHPTISSSVVPFSSCLQSFPASGSFPISQFFASGGQSIGASASASVLPMYIYYWFPLGLTGFISLQSKGLSRVFSNITAQNHKFFGTQLYLWPNSYMHTWLLEKL